MIQLTLNNFNFNVERGNALLPEFRSNTGASLSTTEIVESISKERFSNVQLPAICSSIARDINAIQYTTDTLRTKFQNVMKKLAQLLRVIELQKMTINNESEGIAMHKSFVPIWQALVSKFYPKEDPSELDPTKRATQELIVSDLRELFNTHLLNGQQGPNKYESQAVELLWAASHLARK